MLKFIDYLIEAAKEASAKSRQDSMGKLHELLVAKHLYDGKFPEFYADSRGTRPIDAHDMHGTALFDTGSKGSFYKHPEYLQMNERAKKAADDIKQQLAQKHGITDLSRVAWTSQDKDIEKELNKKGAKSKSDVVVTGLDKNGQQQKIGVSLKVGETKEPNYANPGVETLESWSGVSLGHHVKKHADTLNQVGRVKHDEFRAMEKANDPRVQTIKSSSDEMHKNISSDVRNAFAQKSHKQLRDLVTTSTAPVSDIPMLTSHTIVNKNGSSTHRVGDHAEHVNRYLNQFDNLHADPSERGKTVTIFGIHKKTGKRMPVWRTTIYAGGVPETTTARGMVKLSSESHPDVLGN